MVKGQCRVKVDVVCGIVFVYDVGYVVVCCVQFCDGLVLFVQYVCVVVCCQFCEGVEVVGDDFYGIEWVFFDWCDVGVWMLVGIVLQLYIGGCVVFEGWIFVLYCVVVLVGQCFGQFLWVDVIGLCQCFGCVVGLDIVVLDLVVDWDGCRL